MCRSLKWPAALLLSCIAFTSPAGPTLAAPVSGGTYVTGKCSSGAIATPSDVAMAADWTASTIAQSILKVGQALQGEVAKQTATIMKLDEAASERFRQYLVEFGAAQARTDAQRMYGEQSRPSMGCEGRELGAGIMVGKKAEKLIAADYYNRFKTHNGEKRSVHQSDNWLKSLKEDSISAEKLMPTYGTYRDAAEQQAARDLGLLLTNPYPSPPLQGGELNTREGAAYEARRKLKEARLVLPQKAMADIAAYRSPTMELGAWMMDMWRKAGGQGQPMGIVDGKISANALLDMLVDVRFANANWYDNVLAMNEVGLQREAIQMQALQLEMMRRQMRSLEQIAALLAQREGAAIMDSDHQALTAGAARAASERVEGR